MLTISIYDANSSEYLQILETPAKRFSKHYYELLKMNLFYNLAYHAENINFKVELNENEVARGGAMVIGNEVVFIISNDRYMDNYYYKSFAKENLYK